MSEQELRIAVCESLGFKHTDEVDRFGNRYMTRQEGVMEKWYRLGTKPDTYPPIPPLTLDLMHEAEGTLTKIEYDKYEQDLWDTMDCEMLGIRPFLSATASQRATAFLKVKGKL